MTCSLDFTGAIKIPASTPGLSSSAGKEVPLQFAVNPRQFDRVVSTDCPYTVASAAAFTRLPLSDEMTTVEFVALAVLLSGTAEILIGDKPTILGAGGTFPTGFAGGETYTFELQTYNPTTGEFDTDFTVATTFTVGAQTAQAVANEINAAVMVAGAAACGLVTVDATSGQLVLIGSIPGCKQRLEITTVNATIGFVGTPAKALGSGDPLVINGNFISELVAVAGSKLWIKGSASLNILLAGT